MATTILLRRDTAANWSGVNPVLNSGEPGFEIDTYRLKIGKNGLPWNSLPYIAGSSGVHWSGVTNKPVVISGISAITGMKSGEFIYATGINEFAAVSLSGWSGVNINYSPTTNSIIFSVTELAEVSGTGNISISSGIAKINTPQVILGTGNTLNISGSVVKINGELQVSGTPTFTPSINIYSPGGPGPQCSGASPDLGSPTINLLTYDSNKKIALRNIDGLFEIVGYGSGIAEYGFPFPGDCVAQEEISTFYINPKTGYISMVSGLVSVYPDGSITANTVYANSGIFGYINFSGSNAVTGVIAGTGIGVYQSGSSYIISNSGIIKLIASSGINISGTSGNYTISSALIAGTGIDLSENSGTYTIRNSGVIKIVAGSGIGISAISGSGGNFIISNSGVISIIAGDGISVSSISGDYTISNTGVNSIVAVNPGINITTNNSGIYYIEQKILGGTGIVLGSGVGSDLHIHSNLYGGSGIRVSGSSGIYSLSLSGIPVYSITSGSYIQVINSGGYFTISATGLQPSGDYSVIGHTHTSSGIIDFNSAVSGLLTVKNILQGSGISISGASGNYTISVSGLNSSYISDFNEAVDDRIGSGLFVAGTGINLSYNDTLNTFTISTTGVSLSGHTHTASNITDFNSAVSGLLPVKDVLAGTGISISSSSGIYTITSTGAGVNADSATQSASVVTTVFNKTASTIPKMSAVYINGGQGDQPTIQLAIATGDLTSAGTYGLTYESISSMSAGKVIVFGALVGVNTDQFNPTAPTGDINGSILYLSPTTSGTLTTIKPSAPNHIVAIGTVVRTHQNAGVIEVRVQNGFELDELHNVAISGVTNGQFLQYNSTSGLWIPSSSGNFSTLQVNGTGVSVSGHTHTSSDITNFNSSVSGLLPVKNISGGSGINVSSTSGNFTISVSGLNSTYISDFNEAIDDRIGSGLFVAGTGISLDYNDSGNSFTVAVTGLIANPSNNRILTSRDNTTTGIDAESDLTFENKTLNIGSSGNAGPEAIINLYTNDGGDGLPAINFKNFDDSTSFRIYYSDDENTSYVYSLNDSLILSGPTNYISINSDGTINIVSSGVTSNNNFGIINQTANTIASFDTNKNIVSLSTGTYPSLTELSYVKGVTSAIQTQLNNKQNSLNNPITGTGTTNYVSKFSSSSGLANSSIFDSGNRIGIGTTNPSGQLHVIGSGIFASGINISNQTASTIAGFDSAKSIVSLSTATYPSLTELAYVKGVTSDIQTQLNSKSNTGHTHLSNDVSFSDLGLNYIVTDDTLTNVMYNVDTAFDNVYSNFSSYQLLLTNPITSSAGGTAGYIPKFTNSTNIANSIIYDNGTRIGIGTTSPQQLVHISGNFISAGNILRLQNGNPANRTFVDFRIGSTGNYEDHFFISRSGNDVFGIDTSNRGLFLGNFTQAVTKQFQSYSNANAFIELQNSANNTHIGYISPNNLLFSASYVEKMRLTSGGLLGIGTTTPTGNLHVIGTGIFSTNVGIGTNAPNAALHVVGNTNISGIITATSGTITTLNTVPTYLSPSALSTSQGDWNPGAGDIIRVSASTSGVNISGIVLGNEYTRVLINVGTTHNITLKHQATTATSGNRIITSTGGDHIIPPTGTVTILYDTIDSRWRVL